MTDNNCNTGDRNTGDYNTGYSNTGDCNTGYRNTGDYNTGHYNTGNYNTGHYNTGYYNTGHYNTGNYNTGHFCEQTPTAVFFDQPTNLTHDEAIDLIPHVDLAVGVEFVVSAEMTDEEKEKHPNHAAIGGYLKTRRLAINEAFPLAWAKMDQATRDRFTSLPNFDADKFKRITGVDVRAARKIVTIETIDGQRVQVYAD